MTTSFPCSTRRLARSMTSSATWMWFSEGMSKVEETTSPRMERSMSVASSGRSSMPRYMRCTSGLFAVIAAAMSLSTVVLPALGGDTMRPRWPLPMGAVRSMTRAVVVFFPCSMSRRSSGNTGVRSANFGRKAMISGAMSLTADTFCRAANLSLGRAGRVVPVTISPLRRPFLRMVASPT